MSRRADKLPRQSHPASSDWPAVIFDKNEWRSEPVKFNVSDAKSRLRAKLKAAMSESLRRSQHSISGG